MVQTTQGSRNAWQVICADSNPDCGFMVRDSDQDEIVEIVQRHIQKTHGANMERNDVLGMAKPAEF